VFERSSRDKERVLDNEPNQQIRDQGGRARIMEVGKHPIPASSESVSTLLHVDTFNINQVHKYSIFNIQYSMITV